MTCVSFLSNSLIESIVLKYIDNVKQGEKGEQGDTGKSFYDIAVENGFKGTEEDLINSLKGKNGKSAYDIAVDNGFKGTQRQWLNSLVRNLEVINNIYADADSISKAANGDENTTVTTRLGETYPSAKKAIKTMFENGGLPATPFATKALMTASALANGYYAYVTDDIVAANNGLYQKSAGAWVKSGYDPTLASAEYINTVKKDILSKMQNVFLTLTALSSSTLDNGSFAHVNDVNSDEDSGYYQKIDGAWIKYSAGVKDVVKDVLVNSRTINLVNYNGELL